PASSRQVRRRGIGNPHPASISDEGTKVTDVVRGAQLVHPLEVAEVLVPHLIKVRAERDVILRGLLSYATKKKIVGRSSQRSASQLTGIENFAIGTESWRYAAFKSDRLLQRQLGRCWLIRVSRGDLHSLDCFVEPEATIAELKHVVALESKHLIRRLGGPYRSVSWRQVWRRFALALGSKKLLDDRATLSDCGLSNRCQLTFVPRLREKPSGGRRRRQQWQQDLPVDRSFAVIALHSGSYMTEKDTVTTETVDKTHNPTYSIPLITSYKFEERQMIELEIHCAMDDHSSRAASRKVIGSCTVSLGHLIHSGGSLDCQL
uniref:Ubiquitin_4 domain-containing protein n=1 Tax=Macrostomum lignano TaxID=282301 RepID=A0A1I8IT48_9PLAT